MLEWATRRYGAHAGAITETYRRARPAARPADVLTDLLTDELFRMGCLRVLETRANRKPAWAFQFDYPAQSHDGALGATHCFDLPFTFANFDKWSHAPFVAGLDVEERDEISSVIHRAFIAFARDGRPEHGGLESWPVYALDDRTTLVLDKTSAPAHEPAPGRLVHRRLDRHPPRPSPTRRSGALTSAGTRSARSRPPIRESSPSPPPSCAA